MAPDAVAPPQRRHQLLAGLRRRPVDAAPVDHLHPVDLRARPVLPVAGGHRQGRGPDPAQQPDRGIVAAPGARALQQSRHAGPGGAAVRQPRQGRRRAQSPAGPAGRRAGQRRQRHLDGRRRSRRSRPSSRPEARQRPGAGAGRAPQPADLRPAPPDRRPRAGARRLRIRATGRARPRSPTSARASTSPWPSASRNCRATARTSSAACARSSATARTSASSATASSSSPRSSSHPARRRCEPEGRAEMDKLAGALIELQDKIPDRHSLGAAGRRPYRQPADRLAAISVELGPFGRAAPSPWCNISSPRASRPNAWSPPASASSSPSISPTRTRHAPRTGASSSS